LGQVRKLVSLPFHPFSSKKAEKGRDRLENLCPYGKGYQVRKPLKFYKSFFVLLLGTTL